MKKTISTFALLTLFTFVALADTNKPMAQVRYNNVKMFQQASTSTNVLETLSITDKIIFVRTFKYNKRWAIVTVNDKTGYVLQSELASIKKKG